ncbi:tetratricopeptide repeat protein [Fundidesulfovibrio terrae]|uniref:tetratricopeptide repeat protein n=1 Tax=Fundidesulfovibrio terrae TaxID=2922866 RepID=UPI001FAFB7D4|nr:tetratricopeptide repeat protein [Fundidesulfovibrio terrae]
MNPKGWYCLVVLTLMLWASSAWAIQDPAGRLVFAEGQVSVSAGAGAWAPAAIGRDLAPGDSVRTGPGARAAILCADETQIRLGENTLITLKAVAASTRLGFAKTSAQAAPQQSAYGLESGEAWLRNNNEASKFQLTTPALTAAVRGTEFTASVDRSGFTSIALLDGRLLLSNPQGSLDLDRGEVGQARPGQAPTKQVLVNPEDAVQWVLYYPTAISWRDVKLENLAGPPLTPAEAALDAGDTGAALSLAQDRGDQTALGWVALRQYHPEEALQAFVQAPPSARTSVGRWLAMTQAGQASEAWEACRAEMGRFQATPEFLGTAAYLALGAGQPAQSRALLEKALAKSPSNAFCRSLLAQIDLAQNRKDLALDQAAKAAADNPDSPTARVSMALVQLSRFDLAAAKASLNKALALDPSCVTAYVYTALIELGQDAPDKAWATVEKALKLAPGEASVLSLGGFAKLGMRRFEEAQDLFARAVKADPGLPEPRLGLGIVCYTRNQRFQGLSEMLSATLLDPRVSLYQTSLGKAYYSSRDFDRAMQTYDQAARLDPADPTPHLYKGIALTDLYQPGDAVVELNRSIELNDNRAMFRSRLLLDRDLAVRNFDLAKAYNLLGLGEWAFAKAVTAIKKDPFDSSAHLFLSSAFANTRQRVSASSSELLLYRLLSPANQSTFTLYNDYTPMFEAPYVRIQFSGGVGAWANGKSTVESSAEVYGGVPGVAGDAFASFNQDNGMRKINGLSRTGFAVGQLKWEPTFKDSLFAAATFSRTHSGDTSNQNAWEYVPSPWQTDDFATTLLEGGYVRRQSPGWTTILYGAYKYNAWTFSDRIYTPADLNFGNLTLDDVDLRFRDTPREMGNFQAQQQMTMDNHSLLVGGDVFTSMLRYRSNLNLYVPLLPSISKTATLRNDHWERSLTIYVVDYWRLRKNLILELGLSGEFGVTPRFGFVSNIEESLLGFRFGVNWEATSKDVIRMAVQRYLNNHMALQPMIQPAEVAGFPTRVNADDGSQVVEMGMSWERQWNEATFSILRADFHHIENPQFDPLQSYDRKTWYITDRYLLSGSFNRVLTPYLGLNLLAGVKWLEPGNVEIRTNPETHYTEFSAGGGLTFLYKNGLGATVSGLVVKQAFAESRARDLLGRHRDETPFGLLNASVSYKFPGKRGFVSLEGSNLFDVKFSYQREPVALDSFVPYRRIMFRLGLYF